MYVMISAGARSGPGWNRDLMVKMNCVIRGWVPNSKVETRTQGVKEERGRPELSNNNGDYTSYPS